jgi:hypothetical protein
VPCLSQAERFGQQSQIGATQALDSSQKFASLHIYPISTNSFSNSDHGRFKQNMCYHYNILIIGSDTLPVEPVEGIKLHTARLG